MDSSAPPELVTITATIVAAYVSNNSISSDELPGLIAETHAALSRAAGRVVPQEREEAKPKIAVKKSVMPDFHHLSGGRQEVQITEAASCGPTTTCRRKSIARSGACRPTIRWWRRTTRARARSLPRRWVSGHAASVERRSGSLTSYFIAARFPHLPFSLRSGAASQLRQASRVPAFSFQQVAA